MMMRFVIFVWLVAGLLVTPTFAEVQINSTAPDFTLTDSNGEAYTLSDSRGKYVILEWVNYLCPFVRKHYDSQNMQDLQREMREKGFVWFSINSSAEGKQGYFPTEEINGLMQERGASPDSYLIDTDGTVGKMYGAATTPHMYLIDPEGQLIYQGAIDDNPSFDSSDIPKSQNYVRAAVEEIMSGSSVSIPMTKSYGCSVKY